jgi:hypothetical protein
MVIQSSYNQGIVNGLHQLKPFVHRRELPSYIIFKGKELQDAWFKDLPPSWRINVSPNGWTVNEIGIKWLEKLFIPETTKRLQGVYRMLILDGYGSYLTPEFDRLYAENKSIPICMPAHSSHLLQPLNVTVFRPLKGACGELVSKRMQHNYNHIDKLDFFEAFPTAHKTAFKPQTISKWV